jgi:hypothetical protein
MSFEKKSSEITNNIISVSPIVFLECWKTLSDEIVYKILSFVESIDVRVVFKINPHKLKIPRNFKDDMNTMIELRKNSPLAKYFNDSKSLHIFLHVLYDLDTYAFVHKVYKNIEYDSARFGNTYFTNIYPNHIERYYKYLYDTSTEIFIQKNVSTQVLISDIHINRI